MRMILSHHHTIADLYLGRPFQVKLIVCDIATDVSTNPLESLVNASNNSDPTLRTPVPAIRGQA